MRKLNFSFFYFSDYFEKRASVVACHILPTDPKSAIIEFENEKFAQKILDTPVLRLYGANLLLSKIPDTIENKEQYNNDEIDQLLESTASNSVLHSPPIQNQPFLQALPSIQQMNINQQNLQSPPIIIEPISIPSPE